MLSASVIFGRAEAGEMVQTPVLALQLGSVAAMLKWMVSSPGFWMRLLASCIAALNVHGFTLKRGSASQMPLKATSAASDVELTVMVFSAFSAWAERRANAPPCLLAS